MRLFFASVFVVTLSFAGSAAALTFNPFECRMPVALLSSALSEYRVISQGRAFQSFVIGAGQVTVYAPGPERVFSREPTYLSMMRSADVITLASKLKGTFAEVQADVMRSVPNAKWYCLQKNDCEAVLDRIQIRIFSMPGPQQDVDVTCNYNAGLRGASPARF